MRKFSIIATATAIGLMFSTAQSSHAAILNGSFETGNFNSWSTTGQTTVEDSTFGVNPANGTHQAVLETLQDTTGVSGSEIENFLGLSSGSLTAMGVQEGSAIKQTFTANAGDVLSFSWNFLTDLDPADTTYNDFAFWTLSSTQEQLADTNNPTNFSFSRLAKETGYQPYSYTLASTGTYTLGFGVVDVGDTTVNSALLVDNVRLSSSSTAVPEPTTTFGLLASAAFGFRWRRREKLQ